MAKVSLARRLMKGVSETFTGVSNNALAKMTPFQKGTAIGGGVSYGGTLIAKPIGEGIHESVTGRSDLEEEADLLDRYFQEQATRMQARVTRDRMVQSAGRLAALDPHLYNEVLAGRRLPQGAVVFGGQPRADLMGRLTELMARGAYPQETPPEQQMSQMFRGAQ